MYRPVGDARSEHYATSLGYPAELFPLENPYALDLRQGCVEVIVLRGVTFPADAAA